MSESSKTGWPPAGIVKNFAKREGCIAGICDATPLPREDNRFTPFVSRNILKRTDPAANLPGVKSIIVVGVESKIDAFPPMPEDAGIISVLGAAKDYHVTVKALLKRLTVDLEQHASFTYKILVDSPTLDERALAVRAGLGFLGRNGLVISPEYGSRFNIGVLLTDIPWDSLTSGCYKTRQLRSVEERSDEAIQKYVAFAGFMDCFANARNDGGNEFCNGLPSPCSTCRRCVDACPTGALSDTEGFNAALCISYLTQKDDLTPEEAALMGRHLYGCDICQDVCPFNRPQPTPWAMPEDWLVMSDDEFDKTYGHTAMLWRGAELLRRNAKAIIDSQQKYCKR